MAQTTGAITFEDCKVEISANGSTWTDISGMSNSIGVSGGDRQTGETYTFDGEFAIVRRGKAEPLDIECRCVYTETANEAYAIIETAYEGGSDLYLRWSPKGGLSTNYQFAAQGVVVSPPYPTGEAGNGEPVLFTLNMKVGRVTRSVIA